MASTTSSASSLPPAPSSIAARLPLPAVPPPASAAYAGAPAMAARIARDFRSDTLTVPSDEALAAMAFASRGDDVYQEDATTTTFEAQVAALLGKEAALFCASGSASNQLAVRTHLTQPPFSLVCDMRAHIFRHEAGAAALLTGAHLVPALAQANGHHLVWEDIEPLIVPDDGDVHAAPTQLVCLENSLNGTIFPQEDIARIAHEVHRRGVKLHLDGARLWNVAAETGVPLPELCRPFDSVNLCLSKGLGAPVGSILSGTKEFVAKARHFRKAFGGGMRQTGPLAAAARVAIETGFPKLKATHDLARYAQKELEKLGVHISIPAETNMVSFPPGKELSSSSSYPCTLASMVADT